MECGVRLQDHVRDHVEDYVTTHVILIDGVPCNGEGGLSYGTPLHQFRYRPWYVCPRTGLLRRVKRTSRKRQRQPRQESPPAFIQVSESLQCRFFDNAWHLVTLKPLPNPLHEWGRCRAMDVLLNVPVARLTYQEARRHYGAEVLCHGRASAGPQGAAPLSHPDPLVEVTPYRPSGSSLSA